jgi:hypothetical protein
VSGKLLIVYAEVGRVKIISIRSYCMNTGRYIGCVIRIIIIIITVAYQR